MTAGYPVPQPSARKYLSRGNTKVMLTTVPHHPLSAVFGHEKARQRISDVVPDSWTKNWGPSVWDINGREQLKLES